MAKMRMRIMGRQGSLAGHFEWEPTAEHRNNADRNHGQTLERLNERGGVCWSELEGILAGIRWGKLRKDEGAAKQACVEMFPEALSEGNSK